MIAHAKAILFDLDGTLIDSAPNILEGLNFSLNVVGIKPIITIDRSVIGPPLKKTLSMISGITSKDKLEEISLIFKNYYDSNGIKKTQPYAGVTECLQTLYEQGFQLHIATNKRYTPTQRILDILGWTQWFTSIYAIDKPSPGEDFKDKAEMLTAQINDLNLKTNRVLYVGDRYEDFTAANNNNIKFIGVSWGYGIAPADQSTNNNYLIANSIKELASIIGTHG